jgi:hypothetical protein
VTTPGVLDVTFVDSLHGWAVGGEFGTILATTDGGATWVEQRHINNTSYLVSIFFRDDLHGWAVGRKAILRTSDGGANWEAVPVPGFYSGNAVRFASDSEGWIVGPGGSIFHTTDKGATWGAIASPTTSDLNAVSFSPNGCGLAVGANGTILRYVPAPTLTSFTPAAGPVGTTVTLTGTGFTGATAVTFNGHAATFTVNSDTQTTATAPVGASTGKIAVATPGGTATSAASFTVTAGTVTPKLTLRLSGLTSGALKLGKRVTAKGIVTPSSLAGGNVTLTVQRKQGGKWLKVTSMVRTIRASGAYRATYKPAKKGAYRARATIAKTAAHTAARTAWRTFAVK